MVKTAIKKQKNGKLISIRTRLTVAICMLLISSIMLVTSTYAWFTLSTAPEVKGIDTSVAGNGSLEIALMPGSGSLGDINSGRAGFYGGGTVANTTANNTWGNLIDLSDLSYGLQTLELRPVSVTNNAGTVTYGIPDFGYDGRIEGTPTTNMGLFSFDSTEQKFNNSTDPYGVRAIATSDDESVTYGYVIDLAFRMNAAKDDGTDANLVLQKDPTQRIYNSTTDATALSSSDVTQGGGSYMSFSNTSALGDAIRLAFIQNYGNSGDGVTSSVIAYGKVGADGKLQVIDGSGADVENNVLLAMTKNTVYQISVVVYMAGSEVTNSSFSATDLTNVTLNLQFASDVELNPAVDVDLRDNPPGPVVDPSSVTKAQLLTRINEIEASSVYTDAVAAAAAGTAEQDQTTLLTAYTAANAIYNNSNATQEQINGAYTALNAAFTAAGGQ